MNEQFNKVKNIEDYLLGKLSVLEVQEFEDRLKEDKNLSEEVETQRLLHELVIDRGMLDIKQKIKSGRYDNDNNGWKTYTLLGLAALITSASIGYIMLSNEKKSPSISQNIPSNDIETKVIIQPQTKHINLLTEKPLNQTITKPLSQTTTKQLNQITTKTTLEPAYNLSPVPFLTSEKLSGDDTELYAKIQPEENKNSLIHNNDLKPTDVSEKVQPKAKYSKEDSASLHPGLSFEREKEKITEYAFSPSLGQVWEFPIEPEANCKISIFNKNAKLVYQTTVRNGFINSWNGDGNQGLPIFMGSYIFLIETQDGKATKGYVTITE